MRLAALTAFVLGVCALQWQTSLPGAATIAMLGGGAALVLLVLRLNPGPLARAIALIAIGCIGFAYAAGHAMWRMADELAFDDEGRDIAVSGVIASLPVKLERGVRFEFDVERVIAPNMRVPSRVLLGWYSGDIVVQPGERWAFTVRLKRPHGTMNPGGFDFEAWMLERNLRASGYVRAGPPVSRLHAMVWTPRYAIERARSNLRERLQPKLVDKRYGGVLLALVLGDQRAISDADWTLFNRTGIGHLVSISGLHITMIASLAGLAVGALWRRSPPLLAHAAAQTVAVLSGLTAAFLYALLAGWGVPAQRTVVMLATVGIAWLLSSRIGAATSLALAAALVCLIDPWAVLAPGFWLSFGAVALIFYVSAGWTGREPRALQWLRVQWAITVGLAPAALLLFGQVSVAGPLANAVAIPVVSVVVTPLVLLAVVLPLDLLLEAAAWLVEWLLRFLEWCAALPGALWQQHVPSLWAAALAMAGAVWILAPRGVPWRAGGLALMAPAFALAPAAPAAGEAWITALDVGQGLAVVVRTANRTLLYDAGPAYGPEADSGGRIVVPLLRGAGIRGVDMMVLSHEDMDHLGGALTVLEAVEVRVLASSLARAHPLNSLVAAAGRCAAGRRWEWDGVRFEFLHPQAGWESSRRNNQSCVLRVAAGGASMLLTGDIERSAESVLVETIPQTDILLVPHHGSRTSSSAEFIAAVAPRWAVVPAGYRNRFGHPAREVLERYASARVPVLRTDLDGAVSVVLKPDSIRIQSERRLRPRYWRRV